MSEERRYLLISADGHCGADLLGYRPYLESRYHEEFDEWAKEFEDPWTGFDPGPEDARVGVASFASDLNWDSERRRQCTEQQGIVAEVLFPNTVPPFFPGGLIGAHPPVTQREYQYRLAGIKAHNRWLVDFCDALPGQRAGIAQVFLNDVDDAVSEIRWAHDHGLRGVLLPPDHLLQLSNIYYPRYDPVWRLCEELHMPIHRHSVVPAEAASAEAGIAAPAIGMAEFGFFTSRSLTQMILAGIFDRFPQLRFVMTEALPTPVLNLLRGLDQFVLQSKVEGSIPYLFAYPATSKLSRMPTEYLNTNIYHGSFLTSSDVENRNTLGVDHIMWGADVPHHEGTAPFTRQALQLNFQGISEDEVRQMTSLNAINVYGFNEARLQEIADQIGPTPSEIDSTFRIEDLPGYESLVCPTFSEAKARTEAQNQRMPVGG